MSSVDSLASAATVEKSTEPLPKHATARAAELLLRQSPYSVLKDIDCDFHEGLLVMRGSVPTFYLKQIAQTICRSVAGVRQVVNLLDVTVPEKPPVMEVATPHSRRRGSVWQLD